MSKHKHETFYFGNKVKNNFRARGVKEVLSKKRYIWKSNKINKLNIYQYRKILLTTLINIAHLFSNEWIMMGIAPRLRMARSRISTVVMLSKKLVMVRRCNEELLWPGNAWLTWFPNTYRSSIPFSSTPITVVSWKYKT